MKAPATEPGANPESVRPRSLWLRLLAVIMTLSIGCGITMMGASVAEQLGIDPKDLQGTRFVPSFTTVSIFLVYQALLALVVFASQRVIHRSPFLDLGFRAPALRHLLIGFAVGVAVWEAPLIADLMSGSRTMEWSVPAGVPALTLIGYYFVFFFVFLTANSFGEELVHRCYPIDQFRDSPAMMLVAILMSSLVFAAGHFIVGEFSVGRLIVLAVNACFLSYVYVYHRSIWLIIGLHNASNFVPFTFGGNWKMGGLVTLSGDSTSSLPALLAFVFAPILAMLLFYRFRLRPVATSPE